MVYAHIYRYRYIRSLRRIEGYAFLDPLEV